MDGFMGITVTKMEAGGSRRPPNPYNQTNS